MQIKKNPRFLIFTSLAHFLNDGTLLLFSLLIVYYNEFYHVNITFLGSMAVIYGVISGLISPVIANYADKRDVDTSLITVGLALEGVSVALFALAFFLPSYIYIIISIAVLLLGFAQSIYHPLGSSILSYIYGKNSPTALGINGSFGSIGRSVTPSIITALVLAFGESTGLFLTAAYMLIGTFLVYAGLSAFKRRNYDKDFNDQRKNTVVKEKLDPKYTKFLFIFGSIIFIRSMFISGTTTFLGEYIYKIYDSKTLLGVFLTVSFLGAVIGQPFFGWITALKGGRYTVFMTTILSTIFFFLFLFSKNFALSISIYTVEVFFAMSGFPVLLGYLTQIFPPKYTATASSYIWGIGSMIGGAAGVGVMTFLVGFNMSIYNSFWIMLIFALISTVMLPLIPKKV